MKANASEMSSREILTDRNIKRSLTRKLHSLDLPKPSREPEHFKNKNARGPTPNGAGAHQQEKISPESGPCRLAAGVIGPIAVKPGDAPFDALAEAGKAAVLDDRVVHGAQLAVAEHHVAAAIAARDVVGLPGPERGFMDLAIGGNGQGRIPERAFLLLELGNDGRQRRFAWLDAPVITGTEQPEVQFQRVGGFGGMAERQQGERPKAEGFQRCEEVAHGNPPVIQGMRRCREARARSSATRQHLTDKSASGRNHSFHGRRCTLWWVQRNGVCDAKDWGCVPDCHGRDAGGRTGAGRLGACVQGQRYRRYHRLFDGDPDRCAPARGRSLRRLRQGGEIPRRAALRRRLYLVRLSLGALWRRRTAAAHAVLSAAPPAPARPNKK